MSRGWARSIRLFVVWAILGLSAGGSARTFSPFEASAAAEIVFVAEAHTAATNSPKTSALEKTDVSHRSRNVELASRDLTHEVIVLGADEPEGTTRDVLLIRYRYLRNSALLC